MKDREHIDGIGIGDYILNLTLIKDKGYTVELHSTRASSSPIKEWSFGVGLSGADVARKWYLIIAESIEIKGEVESWIFNTICTANADPKQADYQDLKTIRKCTETYIHPVGDGFKVILPDDITKIKDLVEKILLKFNQGNSNRDWLVDQLKDFL